MSVLIVAALGIAIVLVTILGLRLHPLLGLLLASLFVYAATPTHIRFSNHAQSSMLTIVGNSPSGLLALDNEVQDGEYWVWDERGEFARPLSVELRRLTPAELAEALRNGELPQLDATWFSPLEESSGEAGADESATRSEDAPRGLAVGTQLVAASEVQTFQSSRWTSLGDRLVSGFANTFLKLGIPVTMAAIVGVCLLESGAAARLVHGIMALFGPRGTAPAMTVSGFLLGVPVFFDNVFYLLLPLAKAVGRKRPEKFLAAVMAIIVGATMAHSLVPPTPGPLLVAAAVNVSVGKMMIGGFIVGGLAASVGFLYGSVCGRWVKLTPDQISNTEGPVARENSAHMPLLLAALPIALPIVALGGSEFVEFFAATRPNTLWSELDGWMQLCNDPSLVFLATAIVSIYLLRAYSSREVVGKAVARGISDAGTIVLLTCAGGAFGASLQQLQLADAIGNQVGALTTPWGLLFTAFGITALIRVAQGSATVAMITSAAIVTPVMSGVSLPFDPLYVGLAIGCGSKPLPWMNDSGFWQVATMTGMSTVQTLKSFSTALTLMGFTGFLITLLGAWLFPLV